MPAAAGAPEKPRFDFYKILPGAEEPRLGAERKAAADKAIERPGDKSAPDTIAKAGPTAATVKPADRMWLQAGAFANQSDAESLKARLALAGWEASVQSATLPDQGVRYRVRVGPFDNTDEVNRVKAELGKSGFDAAVIKNQ
jgi:cell division protein FtsN